MSTYAWSPAHAHHSGHCHARKAAGVATGTFGPFWSWSSFAGYSVASWH